MSWERIYSIAALLFSGVSRLTESLLVLPPGEPAGAEIEELIKVNQYNITRGT